MGITEQKKTMMYELGDLLSYEQPTPYIVESTDYNDKYDTPVLTAGKSFILGYTNEQTGIYDKLPVIIFDDFTTASRYVNFPFKVKSSAMKILTANTDIVLPKYIYYRMQIIQFDHSTHKRYWIQQYSKIKVAIPPLEEQQRIVARIEELFSQLDDAEATLQKTKAQLALYRETVLFSVFSQIDTWINLGDICNRVFDGPFGTNLKTGDYVSTGVRVVRLENVKNSWFDDTKQSFVSEEKYETIKKHTVVPSDLIISTFISDSIKVCQLPDYIGYAVNKADCVGITLKKEMNPRFVMYYLASKQAHLKISGQVHGATRPRINTKQIKQISVPVCSIKQQNRIVGDIEFKLSVCESIGNTITKAEQQITSIKQGILLNVFQEGEKNEKTELISI